LAGLTLDAGPKGDDRLHRNSRPETAYSGLVLVIRGPLVVISAPVVATIVAPLV